MRASGKLVPLALLSQAPSFQMLSVDYTIITTLKRLLIVPMIRIGIGIRLFFSFPPARPPLEAQVCSVLRAALLKKHLNTCELDPIGTAHVGKAYISE